MGSDILILSKIVSSLFLILGILLKNTVIYESTGGTQFLSSTEQALDE